MNRIIHVITGLNTGGAETALYRLLKHTRESSYESVVISLLDGGTVRPRIEACGVPVYSLGAQTSRLRAGGVGLRLVQLVRKLQPKIIQGWMYHGNMASQFAGAFLPEKTHILWNVRHALYQLSDEKPLTAGLIHLGARLSGLPSKILYNSRSSAEQHEAIGYRRSQTMVIPNGFDCENFKPNVQSYREVRHGLGLPDDAILIGLIGRFHHNKNHRGFLEAAARLLPSHSNVHFLLAGTNVDSGNRSLSSWIQELNLSGHIHLLGERSDINNLTAALDIATSSSSSEAFPNTLGEAMACGIPCVVTDVGDSAWLVNDTGLVVPARDPEALAQALNTLILLGPQARQALGLQARQRILYEFSIEKVARSYSQVYEGLLATPVDAR